MAESADMKIKTTSADLGMKTADVDYSRLDNDSAGIGGEISNKSLGERIHELFKPEQFVVIHNPTKQDIYWTFMPKNGGEQVEYSGASGIPSIKGRRYISGGYIQHGNERPQGLDAGQDAVVPGESAYIYLEKAIKQISLRKFTAKMSQRIQGEARIRYVGATDNVPEFQDILDTVYKGVVDENYIASAVRANKNS